MPRSPRQRTSGLTLVEAALAIAILAAVLAAFLPTFLRSIRTSKIAEAGENLEQLSLRAAAYFQASHPIRGGRARACLPDPAGPAPEEPSADGVEVDFSAPTTPGNATFRALGWQPASTVRYRYSILPARTGCRLAPEGPVDLVLRAEGDLDADGVLSCFEREAKITAEGTLVPTGALYVRDRVE